MKRVIIIGIFFFNLISCDASSDALDNLRNRLNKLKSFHASFIQKLTDNYGNLIQEGYGDLSVKYPYLFNYHIIRPKESFLISDGKTLWFYDPFIKQVTINWLKDIINNTPFMLIIYNKANNLKKYSIKQNRDCFVLIPKNENSYFKKFVIKVSKDGIIYMFYIIEQDDYRCSYQLKFQKNKKMKTSKFTFVPPYNVTIDDQRDR